MSRGVLRGGLGVEVEVEVWRGICLHTGRSCQRMWEVMQGQVILSRHQSLTPTLRTPSHLSYHMVNNIQFQYHPYHTKLRILSHSRPRRQQGLLAHLPRYLQGFLHLNHRSHHFLSHRSHHVPSHRPRHLPRHLSRRL